MDLSVVVLSWNTADLTLRALASAFAGAGEFPCEVVCVDNASADDTVARVRAEWPQVRVIENESNLGFARGNNRALPFLRGRFVCFLNSDCEAGPGSLAHLIRWLDRHPDVGVAAPRLVGRDGHGQTAARPEPTPAALLHRHTAFRFTPLGRRAAHAWRRGPDTTLPCTVGSVSGSCLLIRRDLLTKLGGFDEGYPFYWEDVDLCRRARDAGFRVAWIPDGPTVMHVGGASTAVAGGPPRRPFAYGLLRYQRRRLGGLAWTGFGWAFAVGLTARALLEPPMLALRALRRHLTGRPDAARKNRASASSWLRFLERDLGGLALGLQARPPLPGRGA